METSGGHGHLWTLDDGTPVHAPPGRLTRNDDGRVCCHLCGRWFDHLGAHLRRHGWTARQYRAAIGLAANRALCNSELSRSIGRRQTATWRSSERIRKAFADGRAVGVRAITAEGRDRRPAVEVATAAAENLRRSRARRDDLRLAELEQQARRAGCVDADAYLRERYEAGDSLVDLQRLTGWSRPRVRARLQDAGAAIRPGGRTTSEGRRSRALILESHVVARIGTDDVDGWLREGRRHGLTTRELAKQAGRSDTWVRTRLAGDNRRAAG